MAVLKTQKTKLSVRLYKITTLSENTKKQICTHNSSAKTACKKYRCTLTAYRRTLTQCYPNNYDLIFPKYLILQYKLWTRIKHFRQSDIDGFRPNCCITYSRIIWQIFTWDRLQTVTQLESAFSTTKGMEIAANIGGVNTSAKGKRSYRQ